MKKATGKTGIDSFTLKMIAMISMLADHIGAVLCPQLVWLRIIGRLAFPIFAYLLVEGVFYTHDIKKYMKRLGVMALVSEIPFDLATSGKVLEFGHQNVFFTLFLGIVLLYFWLRAGNKLEKFMGTLLLLVLADLLRTDYGGIGMLMILCFYLFRERAGVRAVTVSLINIVLMGYIQAFGALALIPISLHNREQGRKMKWFFYAFYPVHLLILFLIRLIWIL